MRSGVLVVSGDPVGPAGAIPDLVRDLFAFAHERGLRVAAVGASAAMADIYREAGMRAIYIGDEAIVDTTTFSLDGRPIRKVRQSVARIERAGYQLSVARVGDITRTELDALERVSERWRAGAPERGFSMSVDELGGYGQDDSRVIVARDADGAARGFLHLVPCAGRPALSLSLMRRDPETPNGLVEFMIARGIGELRDQGIEEVSLNFVAFGGCPDAGHRGRAGTAAHPAVRPLVPDPTPPAVQREVLPALSSRGTLWSKAGCPRRGRAWRSWDLEGQSPQLSPAAAPAPLTGASGTTAAGAV